MSRRTTLRLIAFDEVAVTHFIRDSQNNSIVDCETTKDDVRCLVDVRHFANYLLRSHYSKWDEIINDFAAIQELRGTWFESTPRPNMTTREFAAAACRELVFKHPGLCYVTD